MVTKNFKKVLLPIVLTPALSLAATLDIYQDGAKYRMIPASSYLGFATGVTAVCEGQDITVTALGECSQNERLCKLRKSLEEASLAYDASRYELETLEKLISLSKPTQIEASKWIEAASKVGKKRATLEAQKRQLAAQLEAKKSTFSRQAPSERPLFLQHKCAGELELTLPAGSIGARLLYEADVSDPASIGVTQYIALSNQSGIDISVKEASLYARSYKVYLRPQQFRPWIAQERAHLRVKKSLRKAKRESYVQTAMVEESVGNDMAPVIPAPHMGAVMQTGYKNYHISGLDLPSTGEEIKVKIADYKAAATCALVSYPYRDTRVYRACSFAPKSPIQSHRWRIQKNKRLVSDQAYGTYRDGKYLLSVDVEEEVLVHRKPIVKRDRSSGIFGGSIRKKDGFELTVTNLASQAKTIKIIERIPTSTTDKIKVKLLSVEGAENYTLKKDGKLEIEITLMPKAVQKVKVLFELRYDKEMKVSY